MITKKFYWNDETLQHFKFTASYTTKNKVKEEVEEFVETSCSLEDDETDEMLVNDLMYQIYN